MQTRLSTLLLAPLLASALPLPAAAQVTSYTGYAPWSLAVGVSTRISFTELSDGTVVTTQYQSIGLTFTDGDETVLSSSSFAFDGVGINAAGETTVEFTTPQYALAIEFPDYALITLYMGTTLIGTSDQFAGMGGATFGGVISTAPFDRAVLSDWWDGSAYFDNVIIQGQGLGRNYCIVNANSSGNPAIMYATGSDQIALNDLTLRAETVPANQPYLFFFAPYSAQATFGNGILCAAPGIVLLGPPAAAVNHLAQRQVDLVTEGILPGTLYFQCWFRDPVAGGSYFNTSDGLSITFQ